MKKADAIEYFGSAAELARILKISEAAVSRWGGLIPQGRAYEIESLTDRTLRVNKADYADPAKPCQQHLVQRVEATAKPQDYPCVKRAITQAQPCKV